MLRIFMSETVKAESILFVVVTGIALSTAKTSGLFYGTIILGGFALFEAIFN
jgi:RsiW-degrading membrane proteinase PrsW (M82 family)